MKYTYYLNVDITSSAWYFCLFNVFLVGKVTFNGLFHSFSYKHVNLYVVTMVTMNNCTKFFFLKNGNTIDFF